MLYADRKSTPAGLTLLLYGAIDEQADLITVIGSGVPGSVNFNMRGVTRVNSTGTGAWLRFVQRLHSSGIKMTYSECSVAFVGCLQFVVSSLAGGTVESVFAPFHCKKCKVGELALIKTPDLLSVKTQLANQLCKACKSVLEFDEIFLEYFSFLKG